MKQQPLDVFALVNDIPVWLGSADTVAAAIDHCLKAGAGSYFVFKHAEQKKDFYSVSSDGTITRAYDRI